jgi:hypothetical protein
VKKQYVLRVRQPDGSWSFDMDTPMSKREAEFEAKRNRILLGALCQVWTQDEAVCVLDRAEQTAPRL